MGLIDSIKAKVNTVKTAATDAVQKAVAPPPPAPPPAAPHAAENYQDPKSKPVSITGKATAHVPSGPVRTDLKEMVSSLRSLTNAGSSLPLGSAAAASLVAAPPSKEAVGDLKKAVANDSDTDIRTVINNNPASLNGLTAQEKGKALERLRSGYTSEGDAHAMKLIVESCDSKEELREVVKAATGKSEVSQSDFHKYDKEMTKFHPYLIADKLNPANHSIPEKVGDSDAHKKARALDPSPATSMIPSQDPGPGGKLTDKSPEVQKLERDTDAFVDDASTKARGSADDVKTLVSDAKKSASGMDTAHGGDLLGRTADKLMSAGKYAEAKELLGELKKPPYQGTSVDLAGKFSVGDSSHKADNGNTVMVTHAGLPDTLDKLADRRLAQIAQVEKMEGTLGRKVDPYDVKDLRAYFQKVKETGGMKGAGQEYQQYLNNFVKHPGGMSNTWVQNKADLDDPNKMSGVLKQQTRDASGRMMLDCEGTTYLTGQIFGSKGEGKGGDVWFTSGGGHISASVFDPRTGEGFHVNTASKDGVITDLPSKPPAKTDEQRRARAWNFHAHNGSPRPGQADFLPGKTTEKWAATRDVGEG